MNDFRIYEIDHNEAIRIIADAYRAAEQDRADLEHEGLPSGTAYAADDLRIYTRSSRDMSKNANGGDYSFWLDVENVVTGRVELGVDENGNTLMNEVPGVFMREDWSADWDHRDWGGAWYFVPEADAGNLCAAAFAAYQADSSTRIG